MIVINLLLGWTLIGWVVALAMAARSGAQGGSMSASRMQKGASITYTHSGQRYLFGTTFDPPGYAIWDRERLGNPVERFPYSEHGKTEGLARYRAIEPKYEELPPGG